MDGHGFWMGKTKRHFASLQPFAFCFTRWTCGSPSETQGQLGLHSDKASVKQVTEAANIELYVFFVGIM
jgi:hypothetical protein